MQGESDSNDENGSGNCPKGRFHARIWAKFGGNSVDASLTEVQFSVNSNERSGGLLQLNTRFDEVWLL